MCSRVAALCSACGFRPPWTGCRSSRMRHREYSAWGSCPSSHPFSRRCRAWVRPCMTCVRRDTGSYSCDLAMRDRRRVLAADGARSQVLARSNSGPLKRATHDYSSVCDSLQALRQFVLRPSAPVYDRHLGTGAPQQKHVGLVFGAIAVSHCEGEGHGIPAFVSAFLTNAACSRCCGMNRHQNKLLRPHPALCERHLGTAGVGIPYAFRSNRRRRMKQFYQKQCVISAARSLLTQV